MDDGRKDHLQMIQDIIDRKAQNSFQLKSWTVTLAAALEVFLNSEARPPGSSCMRCQSLRFGFSMLTHRIVEVGKEAGLDEESYHALVAELSK